MLLRLIRLLAPYKWWILLAALLGSATVASGVSLLATSAYLIAAAALHPSVADLAVAIVGVRFFGIARGVFRYMERYVSHTVTLRLLGEWRVWFYQSLEPLAPARLGQFKSGDLLSRAIGDIETLQDLYVRVIALPSVALVVAVGMTVWLWGFSPVLALVLLGAWLLSGVGMPGLVGLMSRDPARHMVAARATMNAQIVDGIQGMADLVAFGQQERTRALVDAAGSEYAAAQNRLGWINALQNALGGLLTNLTLLVVLGIAIGLVNAEHFSGVNLAALALATAASFEAVLPLPQAAQAFAHSRAAARRLFAIVDAYPTVKDPLESDGNAGENATRALSSLSTRHSAASGNLDLQVRNLRFAYRTDLPPALDGISFTAAAGAHVALVGPSGAGKSTLANLLLRFWDYDSGEVQLGGKSLRDYRQSDVRRIIGVISQQTFLFNASIRDNLLLANPQASEVEMVEATRAAQIHDFVGSLPQGYETLVGERGLMLSGGERQRLGLARALLRRTPILLLDEPTANLDAATEREFLSALLQLFSGRTLLLITHRLVGLDAMNEILVLDRGRIVERGSQAELLALEGIYRRLWTLQNRAL